MSKKVKASREEFAEALYYWVTKDLREEKIRETASSLDYEIKNDKDYDTVFRELLILNMYLAIVAVGNTVEDEGKMQDYLNALERLVYDRHYEETKVSLSDWMRWMGTQYQEYQQALESDPKQPLGSRYELSKGVSKRLFGEIRQDPFVLVRISKYVTLYVEYLERLIRQYEVEQDLKNPQYCDYYLKRPFAL